MAEGVLPHVLVGRKSVSLLCNSLLWDLEIPPVDNHEAIVAHIMDTEPALKDNLCLKGAAAAGV